MMKTTTMKQENAMPAITVPHDRFAPASPWYRHRWPWLLMLGPLVVVIAGTYTGYLAFSRPDALVVDDYYTKGKAINQDLRRDRVAAALGMALETRYDAAAGRLSGTVRTRGAPFAGVVRLHLAHATQPSKDLQFVLRTDAAGRFEAALPMLEMARWQVLLEGERRDWRLLGAWKWPHAPEFAVQADPASAS